MKLKLHVWRQPSRSAQGRFAEYEAQEISEHASFLEMLDLVNERLIAAGEEPIAFEHDCREGICGSCGMMVNGVPHGPHEGIAACQLHMRSFADGDEIWIEPWRATAFPIVRDLVVDRSSLDRVIQAGGFISINTGNAQDANAVPIPKDVADTAMDAAACIGCGACVAACPNASAMLFTAAKVGHLNALPQGQPERRRRVVGMVARMDQEGFGNCTNHGACERACPKQISIEFIARLNRDLLKASF
ncbi:MAG TPA: succinate dehydrogenase/fumarate reductase iron-sulfur subunit [Candidatus Polarisedimenticolaceae bacterium]|nr:succinate dehydrogenase/fumarate reductase iron-sulfur subunit [Candidatus Polarisedimenticolaceae bacterium]